MHTNDIIDDFDFDGRDFGAEEGEVVAKFFSTLEAEVAAARLRTEGIHCFLANATSSTVLPHLQTVVRLHVRPTDAAQAREILQEAAIETLNLKPHADKNAGMWVAIAVLLGVILAMVWVRSR